MKKSLALVLAVLMAAALPLSASAHGHVSQGVCGGIRSAFRQCVDSWRSHHNSSASCHHADPNGDGLCDSCGSAWHCSHADANGDGLCDNCGNGWSCPHADADGDGLCDTCGNGGNGVGNGNGNGNGSGWGGGHHGGGHHGGRH